MLMLQTDDHGKRAIGWRRDKLLSVYRERTEKQPPPRPKLGIRNRVSPYSIAHFADTLEPLYRIGLKEELAVSFNNDFTVCVRGLLENKGHLDSSFRGRRWKEKLTGYFDYGLLTLRRGGLILQYGRSFRIWGPGDTDRLLLSDNPPAYDQVSARFCYKRIMLQAWSARLDGFRKDTDDPVSRYIAGHRLSFKPWHNLEIGMSETVLYGRRTGPDWVYLNPFLPYYWEQYNRRQDDNVNMGADFIWWPCDATRVFGELLIDDFQIDFVSELQQIGFDLGVSRLGFGRLERLRIDLQYTMVKNYVYGQRVDHNVLTYNGVVIGSSLGPDSDRFRYSAAYAVSRDLTVALGGIYRRRGEGRVTDSQDVPLPRHEKFPSGTVEKTWVNRICLWLLHGSSLDLQIEAGYLRITNLANTRGNLDTPYASVTIQYDLQRWL
jgi:hypothetical protein